MGFGFGIDRLLFYALEPPKKNDDGMYLEYILDYVNGGNYQNILIVVLLSLLIFLVLFKFYLSMLKDGVISIVKLVVYLCVSYTICSIIFQVIPMHLKEEFLRYLLKKLF